MMKTLWEKMTITGTGYYNWYNVKKELKIPQKAEEEWKAELSDCGEQFPAKGP